MSVAALQVLLDGEGVLKLSNFCLGTEGETLEELFTMLSRSSQAEGEGDKENSGSSLMKRLQGPDHLYWF